MYYKRQTALLLDEDLGHESEDEDAMEDEASEAEEEAVISHDDVSKSVARETVTRVATVTRSGRPIKPPARLIQEMSASYTNDISFIDVGMG